MKGSNFGVPDPFVVLDRDKANVVEITHHCKRDGGGETKPVWEDSEKPLSDAFAKDT